MLSTGSWARLYQTGKLKTFSIEGLAALSLYSALDGQPWIGEWEGQLEYPSEKPVETLETTAGA